KAEYFSAATEGIMIFVAAALILVQAGDRLLHPTPLDNLGIGLLVSVVASVINGVVARILSVNGRRRRSMTLIADGRHLFTDVITSVGVIVGIALVWLTGWHRLDAIVALAVGVNILITGARLIGQSGAGLMDIALPSQVNDEILAFLDSRSSKTLKFHAVRTREAGYRRFLEFHMLVPGEWTVQHGHDVMEDLIDDLITRWPELRVMGHLEPIEDPRSYEDIEL
ncbi:cation diffusion facilitator family transporter, partial [Acidipropionibacterium jensenii]